MFLVIKHNGNPVFSITGARVAELEAHIRNGYQDLIGELANLTGEEVADLSGVTFSPRPVTEEMIQNALLKAILTDRFELENRIRLLEAKAPITAEQYRTALKTKLSF